MSNPSSLPNNILAWEPVHTVCPSPKATTATPGVATTTRTTIANVSTPQAQTTPPACYQKKEPQTTSQAASAGVSDGGANGGAPPPASSASATPTAANRPTTVRGALKREGILPVELSASCSSVTAAGMSLSANGTGHSPTNTSNYNNHNSHQHGSNAGPAQHPPSPSHGSNSRSPSSAAQAALIEHDERGELDEEADAYTAEEEDSEEVVGQGQHLYNRYFDPPKTATSKPQWSAYTSIRGGKHGGVTSPTPAGSAMLSGTVVIPATSAGATASTAAAVASAMGGGSSSPKLTARRGHSPSTSSKAQHQHQPQNNRRQNHHHYSDPRGGSSSNTINGSNQSSAPLWRRPSDVLPNWQELCSGGCLRRRNATGSHLWLTTEDGLYPLAEATTQPFFSFACKNVLLLRATVPLPRGRCDCDCFTARLQRMSQGRSGKENDERSQLQPQRETEKQPSVTYAGLALTTAAGEEVKPSGFPMALVQLMSAGTGAATLFVGFWRVTEQDTLVPVRTLCAPQPVRLVHDAVTLRLVVRDGSFDVWVNDEETATHSGVPVPALGLGEALVILVNSGGRVSVKNIAVAEGERPPESRVLQDINQRSSTTVLSASTTKSFTAAGESPSPPLSATNLSLAEAPKASPSSVNRSSVNYKDNENANDAAGAEQEVTEEAICLPPPAIALSTAQASSSLWSSSSSPRPNTARPTEVLQHSGISNNKEEGSSQVTPEPNDVNDENGDGKRDKAVQTDVQIDPTFLQQMSPPLRHARTPQMRWDEIPLPPPPPGYLDVSDEESCSASSSTSSSSQTAPPRMDGHRSSNDDASQQQQRRKSNRKSHHHHHSNRHPRGEGEDEKEKPTGPFPFLRRGENRTTTLPPEKQHVSRRAKQQQQKQQGNRSGGGGGNCGDSDGEGEGKDPMSYLKNLPPGVDPGLAEVILAEVLDRSPSVAWADIAGVPDAKRLLKEAVLLPLLVPELFTGLVQPWKGVLLYGPPGTGKTMLAKAVASSAKTTFFCVSSALLNNKHYGESEKLVKTLFQVARLMAPSTIFFDEIDAIMTSRGGGADGAGREHEASRRVKSEMLQQMDGIVSDGGAGGGEDGKSGPQQPRRVLVLATTNRPGDLDEAIRRRLEKRIYIPLPDAESREAQVRRYADCLELDKDVDIADIVARTEGYSGADLGIVVRDAAMAPVRRLLAEHSAEQIVAMKEQGKLTMSVVAGEDFRVALSRVLPSVSQASLKEYEKWAAAFGST